MQDGAGRQKYIVTRLCWCTSTSETDCRYHNQADPGWEVCPQKPLQYDRPGYEGLQPKKLWIVNPDFQKPRDSNEQAEEPEVAEAVEA